MEEVADSDPLRTKGRQTPDNELFWDKDAD